MNESSRILDEQRKEQIRRESIEEVEVVTSVDYRERLTRMSKASNSNDQPIEATPSISYSSNQAMIPKGQAYDLWAILDKQREITELDFGQPDNADPTHDGALPSDPTLEDSVTLQLIMYPSYTIKLMQELKWLWQLHQISVRWELSMNAQQSSDYDNCRWDVTNAEASGTLALNDHTEASDLTNNEN